MAPNDYDDDDDLEEEEDEVEDEEEVTGGAKKRRGKKWKDPNKPKRAMSAYFLYSQAMRQQVREENAEAGFGEIARILARQYKELSEKDLRKWEKKAEQDKMRYQEEMKHYVPADDPTGGKKGKKSKKDPNAPKRPLSAYFFYSIANRPKIAAANPGIDFGAIARLVADNYKKMTPKERKYWDEKAVEDRERYNREMDAYKE